MLQTLPLPKKIALAVFILSSFIFLVTALVFVYYLYSQGQAVPAFLEIFVQYHIEFMVIMGLLGVGSGLMLYYISTVSLERQEKKVRMNTELIMRFLTEEDRQIIRLLNEKGGMTTQSEIAKLPKMSRLRAHRAVKRLEEQALIQVHKHGKVNMIQLINELRQ